MMNKHLVLMNVLIWIAVVIVGAFCLTVNSDARWVSLHVVPVVPRESEPVIATFKISNPEPVADTINYRFYANGKLLLEGEANLRPESSRVYRYAYENKLEIGDQVNFVVSTESPYGEHESVFSTPSYPPQIMSSFVSFAAFSTSVMGVMTTMVYYEGAFGIQSAFNVGLICAMVLAGILVFMELTQVAIWKRNYLAIGRLRIRVTTLTIVLLLIFVGMVATRVVTILAF